MKESTKRSIFRWIHLLFSIPLIGYVYSPFDEIPDYAPLVRYFFMPVLVFTGFWLWKGPAIRRFFLRPAANPA